MWDQGTVPKNALYWRPGMAEWLPLKKLWDDGSAPVPVGEGGKGLAYTMDPHGLTTTLIVCLCVYIGAEVLMALSEIAQVILLANAPYTLEQGEANDLRQMIVGWVYLGVFLVTTIFLPSGSPALTAIHEALALRE